MFEIIAEQGGDFQTVIELKERAIEALLSECGHPVHTSVEDTPQSDEHAEAVPVAETHEPEEHLAPRSPPRIAT